MADNYLSGESATTGISVAAAPKPQAIRVDTSRVPPFRPFNQVNAHFTPDMSLSAVVTAKTAPTAEFSAEGSFSATLDGVVALVSANFSSSGHFFSDGYSAPVANFGTSATFSATAVIGGEAYADFTVYTQFSATTVKVGG